MKQYFELDKDEKRLEYILLILFAVFAAVIALGVYFQAYGIDHDRILLPIFFIICGTFLLFFSYNAFSKGNLTAKWTPSYINVLLKFVLMKFFSLSKEKSIVITRKIIGGFGLLGSILCFSYAVLDIARH